jgi:hypothetical protein
VKQAVPSKLASQSSFFHHHTTDETQPQKGGPCKTCSNHGIRSCSIGTGRENIRQLLEFIKPSTLVVSSGVLPDLEIPKITVADGHRMIFPLTKNSHSIEEIKAKASLAPVGRQVVDTSSRLSHQLLFPDDIRVDGDQSAFQNLLSCIQSELGIQGKLQAEPYKFLLYEEGASFASIAITSDSSIKLEPWSYNFHRSMKVASCQFGHRMR